MPENTPQENQAREPQIALLSLRDIIHSYGLQTKKSLGQHFLLDTNLLAKIVRSAGNLSGQTVIEVGPGPGGLTRALLATDATQVIAIEQDERCIEALKSLQLAYPGRLHVHYGDALAINERDFLKHFGVENVHILSNLPYNISTQLLLKWLEEPSWISGMTLMFQKEVADRIAADTNNADYGRLSIICQWLADVQHVFDIPPGAFSPPPKVMSTVLNITPLAKPRYPATRKTLEHITKQVFNQRRKMLRASLKQLGNVEAEALLAKAEIAGERRPETLSVEEFCTLANAYDTLVASAK